MFQITNNFVVLILATIVNLIATAISWQKRNTRTGLYFAYGMAWITFWTFVEGLGYAAVPLFLKVLFAKLEYVGYNFAFIFFALFAFSYAGYEDWLAKVPLRFFFYMIPTANIILAWTNDWHKWLWPKINVADSGDIIFAHGPGYAWVTLTGYLMLLLIIVPLQRASRKGVEFSRRQARLLFYASLIPIIGNLSYLFNSPEFYGIDLTSIAFSISSLLFSLALYGTRLLDLLPIAHDQVIAGLRDGMIVLDIQHRVVDINPVAATVIGLPTDTLIGQRLTDVASPIRSLSTQISPEEVRTELEIESNDRQFFEVIASPLLNKDKLLAGYLIIFHDITARKQAEFDLERRFVEIQQLNQYLNETQSQLVEQQRALAALEERQRLARDLHDSVNQSIHSMVLFADTLTVALDKNNTERARNIMDRLRESANQSLRETRLMLYELQDDESNQTVDLIRNVESRLAMVERRAGIEAHFSHEGSTDNLSPKWQENLFWIAVEALNNSLKHAKATCVKVRLMRSRQQLKLEITDNGQGFDPQQVTVGGLGLRNLHARAELLGGSLLIESQPAKGTTVRFAAELKANQNE